MVIAESAANPALQQAAPDGKAVVEKAQADLGVKLGRGVVGPIGLGPLPRQETEADPVKLARGRLDLEVGLGQTVFVPGIVSRLRPEKDPDSLGLGHHIGKFLAGGIDRGQGGPDVGVEVVLVDQLPDRSLAPVDLVGDLFQVAGGTLDRGRCLL